MEKAFFQDQQEMYLCSYAKDSLYVSLNDIILHSINFGHEFDCAYVRAVCVCH